jgi:kinetochor protein Mis14/NSL1
MGKRTSCATASSSSSTTYVSLPPLPTYILPPALPTSPYPLTNQQLTNDTCTQYILKTFTLASPNLTINGLPLSNPSALLTPPSNGDNPPEPQVHYEYEPFDSRKRDRIEQLISEEEDLLRSIAQLKRRVPQATASKWADATKAGIDADEELLRVVCERVAEDGSVSGRKALEGMGELERQEGVETRWNEAVAGLGRLKRDMPAAVAKMERARVAAGYVSGSDGR